MRKLPIHRVGDGFEEKGAANLKKRIKTKFSLINWVQIMTIFTFKLGVKKSEMTGEVMDLSGREYEHIAFVQGK